jgi:hydrogenase expression/formation protein HypC
MCLAIPGKLVEVYDDHGLKMGWVDYSGTRQRACLEYVPEVDVGAYVVVHAGFAISVLDEEEARQSLELWQEMARKVAEEEGTDIFGVPLKEAGADEPPDGETS